MRRREIIAFFAASAAWPFATVAQQPALPRIGLLLATQGPARNGIVKSLAELGYVDGKTATIEQRSTDGKLERLPDLARELVALPVDVIVWWRRRRPSPRGR